jgi:hypothetical protein
MPAARSSLDDKTPNYRQVRASSLRAKDYAVSADVPYAAIRTARLSRGLLGGAIER